MKNHNPIEIIGIGNYYGGLLIKVQDGVPYWCIENYDTDRYAEIPEYLYEALIKFNKEKQNDI